MKKYPIGIQDFQELRRGGNLYIDKTQVMEKLLSSGKYFFLSRPRRFGKSLLLSTIKYIFLGRKELFKGLWIENREDWKPHPVIHLSFSSLDYRNLGLERVISEKLEQFADDFGVSITGSTSKQKFQDLIKQVFEKLGQVVILIDEYDKPLVDFITEIDQAEKNREVLKNFYSVVKDSDPYIRFFFITGVSKFSKVSLFSDLNHLRDITLVSQFGSLTGYTQDELEHYFAEEIEEIAAEEEITTAELKSQIKSWYNGYLWGGKKRLYNPFSILNYFASRAFTNYWWETGTPTFLIKKLRHEFQYDLENIEASQILFESYTLENLDWKSLLFQTGYLTIQDFDKELMLYTLSYPNREVKDAMFQHLMAAYRQTINTDSHPQVANIKRALEAKDLDHLIDRINQLFATIPYQIFLEKQEAFFHAILHLTFQSLGLLTQSEVSAAKGRVDTVVHAKKYIYVMEFKLDAPASEAMAQIREKRYGSPYLNQDKEVIAIGISFDSKTKSVADWEEMAYERLLAEG